MSTNAEVVQAYFDALSLGARSDELAVFYAEGVTPVEFPNACGDAEIERDPDLAVDAAVIGRQVVTEQHYTIVSLFEAQDHVIVEARWEARLAISIGELGDGDRVGAQFAAFFAMRDGRIAEQRNYDSFDPFRLASRSA